MNDKQVIENLLLAQISMQVFQSGILIIKSGFTKDEQKKLFKELKLVLEKYNLSNEIDY